MCRATEDQYRPCSKRYCTVCEKPCNTIFFSCWKAGRGQATEQDVVRGMVGKAWELERAYDKGAGGGLWLSEIHNTVERRRI